MYDLKSLSNQEYFTDSDIVELMKKFGTIKKYGKGEIVFYRGDHANGIYYVSSGRVRGYFSIAPGEEFSVVIVEEGYLIGEDAFMIPPVRTFDAEAMDNLELIYISTDVLIKSCQSEGIALYQLLGLFMKKILLLANNLISSLQLNGNKKIAFLLLKIYADHGTTINYTHQQLAYLSGLSRVVTTRILKEFEELKIVRLHYKRIEILDSNGLIRILNN